MVRWLGLVHPVEEDGQCDAIHDQAMELSKNGAAEKTLLELELVTARSMTVRNDNEAAAVLFKKIRPDVERLLDGEGLVFNSGYYLDSLRTGEPAGNAAIVIQLLDNIFHTIPALARRGPGAASRGRSREVLQRPIESAAASMLALAGMEGASNAQSQEWHARAWRMITGTRNMELHAAARKGSAAKKILPDAGRKLAELERRFHVALYDWMASSDKKEDEWMHRLRE